MLANSSTQLASLVVFVLLARQMSLADFGVVMLAVLFNNFFLLLVKEGVQDYLVQSRRWDAEFVSTAFWFMLAWGVVLTLFVAFVFAPLAGLIYGQQLTIYTQALAPTLLMGAASTTSAASARREFRFRVTAFRNFLNGAVSGIVALVLFALGFGPWSLIWSRVAAALGAALLLWIAEPIPVTRAFSRGDMSGIVKFSAPILSSRVLSYFALKVSELLLAFVIGPAGLAVFRVGGRINESLSALFVHPIVIVALSTFAKVDKERAGQAFIRLSTALIAFSVPVYYGGAAIANDFVDIFFGEKWHESGPIMSFILLAATPMLLRATVPAALKAADSTTDLYRFSVVEILSGMFWSAVTVHFGPTAVAFGAMVDPHGSLFINRDVLRRSLGIRLLDVAKAIAPYTMAGLIMFAVVKIFEMTVAASWGEWPRLLCSVAIGGIIYPGLLLTVWRHTLATLLIELEPLAPQRVRPLLVRFVPRLGAAE